MHRVFAFSTYKGCVNRENGEVLGTGRISGANTDANSASDFTKSGIWLDCVFAHCSEQRLLT